MKIEETEILSEKEYKVVEDDTPSNSLIKTVLSQVFTIEKLITENENLRKENTSLNYELQTYRDEKNIVKEQPTLGPPLEFDEIKAILEFNSKPLEKTQKGTNEKVSTSESSTISK